MYLAYKLFKMRLDSLNKRKRLYNIYSINKNYITGIRYNLVLSDIILIM
jgi:hypothetical protein